MDIQSVMGSRPRPYVMAHRGNSVKCPENTMAAFRQAIADGADMIETDLHVSADGELVCIHDSTVDRTTNGQGAVKDMALPVLKSLSASYGRPAFESETIPTLRELFEIVPARMAVALELKADDFLDKSVCLRLRDLLHETGLLNRVVILSFSRARLRAIQQYVPELPTGLISMFSLLPVSGWSMVGSFWPMLFLNPLYTWMGHRQGQVVCPLDPTPESRLWFYRLVSCDAVLANDPAQTRRALGRSG